MGQPTKQDDTFSVNNTLEHAYRALQVQKLDLEALVTKLNRDNLGKNLLCIH